MQLLSLLFGALVGLSLGLTGGGGAIFAVPLLTYALGVAPRQAIGISLVAVAVTSLVGFIQRWLKDQVEIRIGAMFAVASMLGVPLGVWLGRQVPDTWLMLLFSLLMLSISARMWRQAGRAISDVPVRLLGHDPKAALLDGPSCRRDAQGRLLLTTRCARMLALVGIFTGILSGMFGIGGGFIIVPSLMFASNMSLLRAVGTSLMVICLTSSVGLASELWAGQNLPLLSTSLFVVGGLMGMSLGLASAHRIPAPTLQRAFSIIILIVATLVILRNIL